MSRTQVSGTVSLKSFKFTGWPNRFFIELNIEKEVFFTFGELGEMSWKWRFITIINLDIFEANFERLLGVDDKIKVKIFFSFSDFDLRSKSHGDEKRRSVCFD